MSPPSSKKTTRSSEKLKQTVKPTDLSNRKKKTEALPSPTPQKKKTTNEGKRKSPSPDSHNETKRAKRNVLDPNRCKFLGNPIPISEAEKKWPNRYESKSKEKKPVTTDDGEEEILYAKCHYSKAKVYEKEFVLGDDVTIKGDARGEKYIGRIVEFFETTDGRSFFTAQWFYKAEDTVIEKTHAKLVDKKRLFISEYRNDNPLDCILDKLSIVRVDPNIDLIEKRKSIPLSCDYYYDMCYSKMYSTFSNIPPGMIGQKSEVSKKVSPVADKKLMSKTKSEMTLLDLYSGCGAMSTGLCLGSATSGVNLVTKWAVDFNEYACESVRKNHTETVVRHEKADNFLILLKEWRRLCEQFSLLGTKRIKTSDSPLIKNKESKDGSKSKTSSKELEVEKLVDIRIGHPDRKDETAGLYFKVRWMGYGPDDDTWEPLTNLVNCHECIQDFVKRGYQNRILPLPGDVDVICGGPPCQGISGFNRFRNKDAPLDDEKNHQLIVYMDTVDFLKPKYVLMENVVDIVKFADGYLIRYAMGRLASLDYQMRLGMLAAGCYGLPQFRMRVFLWGACPTENLPSFPLPTHDVVLRGTIPTKFEDNVVAYDVNNERQLEKAVVLGDALSELPQVKNDETREEMPYGKAAQTAFQRFIRSNKIELMGMSGPSTKSSANDIVYDHLPFQLNNDDYQRVCQIPKRKNANFRDLPGVLVNADKKVELDPSVPRIYLKSKKPLVPDYAITFKKGYSFEPFGRLWWDETVPTVVTRPQPHNRVILHPIQDRILTLRENARLQGFPDYYRFYGPMKERYTQVGNAVAVPVARALGHALGVAYQGSPSSDPLLTLPDNFSLFH